MHRAFRRAFWSLTLGCGVSLVPIAVVQAQMSGPVVVHHQGETSPNRDQEIQVELAWLGDPMTFPCQMVAHIGAEGLELRGYVPNNTVKDQAIRLARRVCPLPVVDHLRVHANVGETPRLIRGEVLQFSVADCLKSHFPDQVAGMKTTCNDKGQVTVTGHISSLEDKLAVSHELRRISGCTCIHNQLKTAGDVSEIGTPMPKLVEMPPSAPVRVPITSGPAAKTVVQEPARMPEPKEPPRPESSSIGTPSFPKIEVVPVPPPALPPMPVNNAVVPPVQHPTNKSVSSMPSMPAVDTPKSVSSMPSMPPVNTSKSVTSMPSMPAVDTPKSVSSMPSMPAVDTPKSVSSMPSMPAVDTPKQMPLATMPAPTTPHPVGQDSWKPSPAIAQSPATPAPPIKGDPTSTLAMPPAEAAQSLGDPYVTTGFVMIADPERTPPAVATPQPVRPASRPARPSDAAVKASIEKVCGSAVRDVQVTSEADSSFVVRFHVATKADGRVYFNRIATIPELSPYRVECKVSTDEK
jgi:hypothetical protein